MKLRDLWDEINRHCITDDTSFPPAEKARSTNYWYYEALSAILMANRNWRFDDARHAGYAILTTNSVQSQASYDLPDTTLRVLRVFYDKKSLTPINDEDYEPYIDFSSDGTPSYYSANNVVLTLVPAPNQSNKEIRIHVDRKIVELTGADDPSTITLSLPEHYQRIIIYGAASDYWAPLDEKKSTFYFQRAQLIKNELKRYATTVAKPMPRMLPDVDERNFT